MGKNKRVNVVYSTNPNFEYRDDENEEQELLPKNEQLLKVAYEAKGRAGKPVTVVRNFIGPAEDLKALEKLLKVKCGVGGSSKKGEIILQGDHRDKIIQLLEKEGYEAKKTGG